MAYFPDRTIPDDFQRLDSGSNGADAFANTRDFNVILKNHNKLLATRNRRVVLSSYTVDENGDPIEIQSIQPPSAQGGDVIMTTPVFISSHTKEIEVNLRASGNTGVDYMVKPFLATNTVPNNFSDLSEMTVTGTSETLYSVDVPVPQGGYYPYTEKEGFTPFLFGLAVTGTMSNSPDKVAEGFDAVGPNWIEESAAFGSDYTGFVCVISTNTSIEPRYVAYMLNNNTRAYVTPPWNILPDPNSDQYEMYTLGTLKMYTLSVYEKEPTNFYNTVVQTL